MLQCPSIQDRQFSSVQYIVQIKIIVVAFTGYKVVGGKMPI